MPAVLRLLRNLTLTTLFTLPTYLLAMWLAQEAGLPVDSATMSNVYCSLQGYVFGVVTCLALGRDGGGTNANGPTNP